MCATEDLMMITNEKTAKQASSNSAATGNEALYDCLFIVATATLGFAIGALINLPLEGIIIGFLMFFILKGIMEQIFPGEEKIATTKDMEKAQIIMTETAELINDTLKQQSAIMTLQCAQADKAELLLTSNYILKQKIEDAISAVQNIGKQISYAQQRYLYNTNIKKIKFIDEFNANLNSSINNIECSLSEHNMQCNTSEYQMPMDCLIKGP